MKRSVLLVVLTLFCVANIAAQSKIAVTYRGGETLSNFESGLMRFSGLDYMEIDLDSKRTLTGLTETVCRDGIFTDKELLHEGLTVSNVNKITFYAQSTSADSVKIMMQTDGNMIIGPRTIFLPNENRQILMETFDTSAGEMSRDDNGKITMTYLSSEPVPLIAYTTGLEMQIEWEGENVPFIHYCGLRDKHENPRLWNGHGIRNYVYYTATFD